MRFPSDASAGCALRATLHLALVALAASGCADDEGHAPLETLESEACEPTGMIDGGAGLMDAALESDAGPDASEAAPDELDAGPKEPPRLHEYIEAIRSLGTGCSADAVHVSPEGELIFSGFEAEVDASTNQSFKDCTLNMKLRTPEGHSVAVRSLTMSGYAHLDPGVRAMQTAKYYFQGFPVPAVEKRTDLAGPKDQDFLFEDRVALADVVWSPCGAERDLNVVLRLGLYNEVRQDGYIRVDRIKSLEFATRKCDDGSTDGPRDGRSAGSR